MAKSLKSFSAPITNGALKSDELPSRIKVLNWGANKTLDGEILLDEESFKVFYANQASIGRTLCPVDFNHNTVPGTTAYKADKEPRAVAAYGVPTIIPGDGMYWEYLQWTPSGHKSARDYADLSPTVLLDENKRVIGVHSCALTPAGSVDNLSFYSADSIESIMGHLKSLDSDEAIKKEAKAEGETAAHEKKEKEEGDDDDELHRGAAHEKREHGISDELAHKLASDHLKEDKHYYKKLKALSATDHKSEYGDVEYADTKNHKYPINTEQHVRAAWSYIHMPKNHKNYSGDEVEAIKRKIAAKAKHFGIELKAESADSYRHQGMGQANAYVQDPYKGIDHMLDESLEYFRKELGMSDEAKPDDIMKVLRAKWEGLEADKQVLPEKTPKSSTDPEERGHGDLAKEEEPEKGRVVIAYAALEKKIVELAGQVAALTPLSAEITQLKNDREANAKRADKAERDALVAECGRTGKVIPLSAEEIEATPLATLKSMVSRLQPNQIATTSRSATLRPLSADGTAPKLEPGSKLRAVEAATRMFAEQGVVSSGPIKLG